jgi:Lysine methyltransferase
MAEMWPFAGSSPSPTPVAAKEIETLPAHVKTVLLRRYTERIQREEYQKEREAAVRWIAAALERKEQHGVSSQSPGAVLRALVELPGAFRALQRWRDDEIFSGSLSLEEGDVDDVEALLDAVIEQVLDASPGSSPVASSAAVVLIPPEKDARTIGEIPLSFPRTVASNSGGAAQVDANPLGSLRVSRARGYGAQGQRASTRIANGVWASSVVLLRWLAQRDLSELQGLFGVVQGEDPQSSVILEVGAGLGVAGLGARLLLSTRLEVEQQMAGPRLLPKFFITDADGEAVGAITRNAELNGLSPKDVQAALLDWDNCDFAKWPIAQSTARLVLGADILHEREHAAGVVRVLKFALAMQPRATALIVNPAAAHRFGVDEFLSLLRDESELVHHVEPVDTALLQGLDAAEYAYEVHTVRWRSP